MAQEATISRRKRLVSIGLSLWRSERFFYFVCLVLALAIGVGAYLAYTRSSSSTPAPRFQHTYNTCTTSDCHGRISSNAKIYVAVNGKDVTDDPSISVAPNDTFEVDFHFAGLKNGKNSAVGAQIRLPDNPGWVVNRGTSAHPAEWSSDADGRNFWSSAWDQGASNGGKQLIRWSSSVDRRNVFYANFTNTAWSKGSDAPFANDSGNLDDGDLDGKSGQMGIDAIIGVPMNEKAGEYQVEVAGIGRDSDGKPASVSQKIVVRVLDPSDPALGERAQKRGAQSSSDGDSLEFVPFVPPAAPTPNVSPTPTPEPLETVYERRNAPKPWPTPPVEEPATVHGGQNCKACHDSFDVEPSVRGLPVSHKGRGQETCRLCHMRPNMGPYNGTGEWHYIVPRIPHGVVGRDDCLSCHQRPGGVKPVSSTHAGRTSAICRGCHQLPSNAGGPPLVSHPTEGRENCLSCHGPGGALPVPGDHKDRKSDVCQVCHLPASAGPEALTGYAIAIPHSLDRHADCSRCHQVLADPAAPAPVPTPARPPARPRD